MRKSVRLTLLSSQSDIVVGEPEADIPNEDKRRMELAMQTALQNPLIVKETMGYLCVRDLMACRRVNRMWKSLSSSILLSRDPFVLKLQYNSNKKRFQQQQPNCVSGSVGQTSPCRQLKDLNDLLQESHKEFPCTNFGFSGGNLEDVEPRRFFRLNGENIRTLELSNISFYCRGGKRRTKNEGTSLSPSCFTRKSVLRKLLLNSIPNVKSMSFKGFDFNWTDTEKIELSSLEIFSWEGAMRTALVILKGAKNLRRVKGKLTSADTRMLVKCHNEAALQAAVYSLREGLRKLELQSDFLLLQIEMRV